jgi:glycosyltransferase involved in cell wall biosynthesis
MKKRIAILLMEDYTHDSRVKRTAHALAGKWQVKVICLGEAGVEYPSKDGSIDLEFITLLTRSLAKTPGIQFIKSIEYYLRTIIAVLRFSPDLVYANDVYTLPVGIALRLLGIHLIYDAHEYWRDTHHRHQGNGSTIRWLYRFQQATIRLADRVITIGPLIAKRMADEHHIPLPVCIPNTCPAGRRIDRSGLREKYSLPANRFLVLFQGMLTADKGLGTFFQSIPLWTEDCLLIVQGDGPDRPALEYSLQQLGVTDRVLFLGMAKEPALTEVASACDAGVVTYRNLCQNHYLTLSNKFFAYTINGCPVLASNFPHMRLLIDEYHLGLTFDPESPEDIARTVNEAYRTHLHIEEADYQRFVDDYAWENVSTRLVSTVSRVLERKSAWI